MNMPENIKPISEEVQKILDNLTDRERKSLEKRFGKIDENQEYKQIGQDLEAIRRRIREIEAKALRKLRKSDDEPPDDIA
jgi:RNA polymerase primary sigma factor